MDSKTDKRRKSKAARIPKSRAKTAYALLTEVKRLGLEEPKRMAMNVSLTRPDKYSRYWKQPRCGTVGCIAGWVAVLTNPDVSLESDIIGIAQRKLGLTRSQANDLFLDDTLCNAENPQTRARAQAVARHIEKFQREHAARLKAKKIGGAK